MSESELPIPEWDGLPMGDLESRLRALEVDELHAMRDHEEDHANRIQVMQLLDQRIKAVESGAEVSDGDPAGRRPGTVGAASSGDNASAVKEGPPVNPPSHGDPTNPAQPRG